MIYISLSWSGFLTLLSARNDGPFWTSPPGAHLLCAFAFSVTATALIGGLLKVHSCYLVVTLTQTQTQTQAQAQAQAQTLTLTLTLTRRTPSPSGRAP